MTEARKLNDIMEFDHVITVHEDGTVTDGPSNLYAPNLDDSELDDPKWSLITYGYTGQDRYNGPIMHNSEFIGGRLEKDILSQPGIYVGLVAYWTPEEEGDEDADTSEGWAIARYNGTTTDTAPSATNP